MGSLLRTVVALLAALAAFGMLWRWASRRRLLPCPPWLSWTLENRLLDGIAGGEPFLDASGVAPGMRVLDAGCGPGRLTLPLAHRVGPSGEVVALDVQPRMLARVRQKTEAAGVGNVHLLEAGLGAGALAGRLFDRAFLALVLGEIPDRHAALGELYASLRPGGLLTITESPPDPHFQRLTTLRRLAGEAGFHLESVHRFFPGGYTARFRKPPSAT